MARNKYRAMALGKRALSLTLATSLSISTVAGVGATEISLESSDIVDNLEEIIEEENQDDLLHALEEKMTYEDIVALKGTLSDAEIIEMKVTLDGEVLEWFLEVFADEIDAIENPEEEIEELEEAELEEEIEEEVEAELEEEVEAELEEEVDIQDVVLGDIIEAVETKLTYEELVDLKEVVTYKEILLMKEHLHGETLEWFLEIFADEIVLAENAENEVEEVENGLPQVDVLGGGSEGGNLLAETQEVMFMSEAGVMMMTEVAPIEVGGFASLEAGSYLVPVSIKNISDTSIKDVSSKAIESAILVIDDNGNGTLTISPKTYTRNGFGSGIDQLTQKETYLSDFAYYVSDGSDNYVADDTGVVEDSNGTSKVVIENIDDSVNAMYVSYTQNSASGETIDTLAYLEIDYANAGDVVYYFGEEQVSMKPGSYDDVLVSFTSVNSASGALSGTTGTLTVEDDGSASITVNLGTYNHNSVARYIGDIISDNGGDVEIISGTEKKPTQVKFEILDINSNDIAVTHKAYANWSDSQTNENQKGTFSLNYMNYIPEVEYDDEELAKRYTFGSNRTMFAPGTYDISAYFKTAGDEDSDSVASNALVEEAELIIDADGNAEVILEFQEVVIGIFPGNAKNFKYFIGNDWIDGTAIDAEVVFSSGGFPRKIKVPLEQVHDDGVYIQMYIDGASMTRTGYMLLNLSSVGEVYDKEAVTLRDGEDYWEASADHTAPEITITGHSNRDEVKLEQGDGVNNWTTPTATSIDDVDGEVTTYIFYASFDEYGNKIADLDDEDAVKTYLNAEVGNIARVYYTSQDLSENSSLAYISLVSTEVDTNVYLDVTKNGVYSVPIKLLTSNSSSTSAGDPAFDDHREVKITTVDGEYFVEVEVGTMTMGVTAGIANITAVDTTVIYDLVETEKKIIPDGTEEYTSKFTFKTDSLVDAYKINFDIVGMGTNYNADLNFDFDKATKWVEPNKDGFKVGTTYYAPIKMMQYYKPTEVSMGDKALDDNRTVAFTVDDKDEYTVEVKMGTVAVGTLIDGISEITSIENDITIFDVVKTQDASTYAGEYVSEFKFTTTELKDFFDIEIDVAAMGTIQSAKLAIDWNIPEKSNNPVMTSRGYINGDTVSIEQSLIESYNQPTVTAVDYNGADLEVSVTYVADNGDSLLGFAEVKTYLAQAIGNKVTATYIAIDSDNNESTFVIGFESKEDAPTTDHDGFKVGTVYSAPVKLMQYYNPTEVSMGDKAFDNSRNVTFSVNESGLFTVDVEMGTVTVGTLIDGISEIYSKTNDITISNIKRTKDASTVAGEYISSFTFTTENLKDMFDLGIYVSAMGNDQSVKMAIDWDSAVEHSSLYYTFGSKNTMFNVGNHAVNVKVFDPSDKVSDSELLTSAIADNAILTVDGDGNGKVTLNIGDIQLGEKNYEVTNLNYYTANEIDPTTLQNATGNVVEITNYNKDGFYISVDLGDSYISVGAYVEVEYTDSATAESYDASKVAKRVVPEEDNDGSYKEGYDVGYSNGYTAGLNSGSSSTPDDPLGNNNSNNNDSSSDSILTDIKSDGIFEVPVYLYHANENNLSMGDDAFKNDRTTTIINDDGEYTFDISISTVTYGTLVGGISNVTSSDGKIYDIQQEYSIDSAGEKYVSRLFFKTKTIQDYYDIGLYIPVMGSNVSARLTFDWNNLKQTSSSVDVQYIYIETISAATESTTDTDATTDISELSEEELAELLASLLELEETDDITVNGQYLVPVSLMHETNDQLSMGDPAFAQNRNVHVVTKDGNYTVTVTPSTITMGDLTSGIGSIVSTDGKMKGLNILEYGKLSTNEDYITSFQFTTNRLDNFFGISITVPNSPMGVTGARLSFDWDKAVSTNKPIENGVPITIEAVTQLAELGNDLVVQNGKLKMTFDSVALQSINEQANGQELIITIEEIEDEETLTDAQRTVINGQKSYYLQVLAGTKEITDFGDGIVTVELYHFLERNKQTEGLSMWYVGDNGDIEVFECEYDDYDRLITFETSHFSVYTINYDETFTISSVNGASSNASSENQVSDLPFEDVKVSDWFYPAVKFTFENNIFAGVTETTFNPQDNITKATLITLLYRLAGSPDVSGRNQFTDVLSEQYYSKAILWAVQNDISSGHSDGTFGINELVTREQMVTIIYNYGKYQGMDMTSNASIDNFSDRDQVSDYAVPTFEWAITSGIVSGDGSSLSPKGNTKRCEIATILMNLSK